MMVQVEAATQKSFFILGTHLGWDGMGVAPARYRLSVIIKVLNGCGDEHDTPKILVKNLWCYMVFTGLDGTSPKGTVRLDLQSRQGKCRSGRAAFACFARSRVLPCPLAETFGSTLVGDLVARPA